MTVLLVFAGAAIGGRSGMIFAFDYAKMLAGHAATYQYFNLNGRFNRKPAAVIAVYPMYRGLAKLVGTVPLGDAETLTRAPTATTGGMASAPRVL